MIEQRLPVVLRWMLLALGATEGRRVRRPIDPVAAWLLKEHPTLLPSLPQPALLTTIRARTDIVDRMLGEEFYRAAQQAERVSFWTFGPGFDARWLRLPRDPVVTSYHEVEAPDIAALKARLLATSPFADAWSRIERRAISEDGWCVEPPPNTRPVVLLEVSAGRFEENGLRLLLQRIRGTTPTARVLLGLPAMPNAERKFGSRSLAALGWRVEEDCHMATRGRLVADLGHELCPGMYPFRVVRMSARETLQA